jgi:hypothetical protein
MSIVFELIKIIMAQRNNAVSTSKNAIDHRKKLIDHQTKTANYNPYGLLKTVLSLKIGEWSTANEFWTISN